MKPGIKTTEFWLTLATQVVGALLSTQVLAAESEAGQIVGGVLQVVTAIFYLVQRANAKNAHAERERMKQLDTLYAPRKPEGV